MKFRCRYTGELKLTETPAPGSKFSIGQSRQVRQGTTLEFTESNVLRFEDSFRSHVKAGLLVPVDTEGKAFFSSKK